MSANGKEFLNIFKLSGITGLLLVFSVVGICLSFPATGASYSGINPVEEFQSDSAGWESLVQFEERIGPYLSVVRAAVAQESGNYPVDPVLVLAVIRRESSFNSQTISSSGAAGPMQLMPETARSLGLEVVYVNRDYEEGRKLQRAAHNRLNRAMAALRNQEFERARGESVRWKDESAQAQRLMEKYREELRRLIEGRSQEELKKIDQRFVLGEAIPAGVAYLAQMLNQRDGDIREALAAYNAGPGAVSNYEGIPPFTETVNFQNRVVNSYRKYRKVLLNSGGSTSKDE